MATHETPLPTSPHPLNNPFRLFPTEVNQLIFDKYILHHLTQLARKTGGTGNLLDLLLVNKFFKAMLPRVRQRVCEDQATNVDGRLCLLEGLSEDPLEDELPYLIANIHRVVLPNCRIIKNPHFDPKPHIRTLMATCANAEHFNQAIPSLTKFLDYKTSPKPKKISNYLGEASSCKYWDEVEGENEERKAGDEKGFVRVLVRPSVVWTEQGKNWGGDRYWWAKVIIYGDEGRLKWVRGGKLTKA